MKKTDFTVEYHGCQAMVEGYLLNPDFNGEPRPAAPAVLICPGGAYCFVSDREGEPIARRFNAVGMNAFVLHYTVAPGARFPTALVQAAKAMTEIRHHAKEWNILADKIAVCGFSAGGHLAASLGVLWNAPVVCEALAAGENARPDAQILCYPVITSGEFAHEGSFINLLGEGYSEETAKSVSLEKLVSSDTPPAFLWHTVTDDVVPVENSMLYAAALRRAEIPFEMHLYERGSHGLSLCEDVTGMALPDCAGWFDLAAQFLRRLS